MRELHRGGLLGFFLAVAVCLCAVIWAIEIHETNTEPPPLGVAGAEDALQDLAREVILLQMNRNAALQRPADAFPQLLTHEEKTRFQKARDLLRERTPPKTPFAMTAELRITGDKDVLALYWLEWDEDTAGVILRQRSQDGTSIVEEEYPVFLCASRYWRGRAGWVVRALRFYLTDTGDLIEHIPPEERGSILEHQGFAVRWRSEGQAKDEEYWRTYMAADREKRKTMRKPVMWISRPNNRTVSIALYDAAGNRSDPVEVVEVGENNTWLQ